MLPASSKFRPATPDDKQWVIDLFVATGQLGDKHVANSQWFRFWQAKNPREHWIVDNNNSAFCHYLVALDGTRSIYEIAVAQNARRTGLGKAMIEQVGVPVRCKTDVTNVTSNAFYASAGFLCVAKHKKRNSDGVSAVWYKG